MYKVISNEGEWESIVLFETKDEAVKFKKHLVEMLDDDDDGCSFSVRKATEEDAHGETVYATCEDAVESGADEL